GMVVPTGYSFDLDGTNIYMTLAALFIAQATDIDLSLGHQITLLLVAMLSSKGAAGVTGAGFITLAATLAVVPEVPVAGMALILGVDRFMSECRSLTNFIGNAVATVVVSRWEGMLDRDALARALDNPPGDPVLAQETGGRGTKMRTQTFAVALLAASIHAALAQTPQAQPASSAQEQAQAPAPATASQEEEPTDLQTVQVVGSHIAGAATTDALPVVVLDADAIDASGAFSGDELLRDIPQMGDVLFDASNNPQTSNAARGDVNSVNLRSLGVGNTLVLLNGRRLVQHPTSQGTSDTGTVPVQSFNSNSIPVDGLDRLEVLLDGAAAIYGADAVAGVVNTV